MLEPEFRPERLIATLVDGGVDFVVIGGLAVIAHGYVRTTKDVDIAYDASGDNLERLGRMLVGLEARLSGAEDVDGFVPDASTLRRTSVLTLSTRHGRLDLLVDPAGAPKYRELRAAADEIDLLGTPVRIASLGHLTAMKRAAGRPLDEVDLDALATIERLQRRERRREVP